MNEEKTNIVPYNNGGGSAQPPAKDYSNSNRSKTAAARNPRNRLQTGDSSQGQNYRQKEAVSSRPR